MLHRMMNASATALDQVWSRHGPRAALLVSAFALYLLAAGLGRMMPRTPEVAVIIWLPAGVFVAALLLTPVRAWAWLVLVQCLSELAGNAIWFHNPWHHAFLYFVGNALAALFAATAVRAVVRQTIDFTTPRQAVAFVVLGACAGPLWSAGVIALVDLYRERHAFADAFKATWLGDATGMLVMTPLLVIGVNAWGDRSRVTMRRGVEAVVVAGLLAALAHMGFTRVVNSLYLTLPVLIWASMRFQLPGAAGGWR